MHRPTIDSRSCDRSMSIGGKPFNSNSHTPCSSNRGNYTETLVSGVMCCLMMILLLMVNEYATKHIMNSHGGNILSVPCKQFLCGFLHKQKIYALLS